MEYDEECMRILYAAELPTRLNEERLIFELTDFPFYTCLTLDTACIPREVLRGKISNSNFYNEAAIGQEIKPMPTWVTSTASHRISRRKNRLI